MPGLIGNVLCKCVIVSDMKKCMFCGVKCKNQRTLKNHIKYIHEKKHFFAKLITFPDPKDLPYPPQEWLESG